MKKRTPACVFGKSSLPLVSSPSRAAVVELTTRRTHSGRQLKTELWTMPDGAKQLVRMNANGERVGVFLLGVDEQVALIEALR